MLQISSPAPTRGGEAELSKCLSARPAVTSSSSFLLKSSQAWSHLLNSGHSSKFGRLRPLDIVRAPPAFALRISRCRGTARVGRALRRGETKELCRRYGITETTSPEGRATPASTLVLKRLPYALTTAALTSRAISTVTTSPTKCARALCSHRIPQSRRSRSSEARMPMRGRLSSGDS
jgi:hypothetical protein